MIYKDILLRIPESGDLDLIYRWENNSDVWHLSDTHAPFSKHSIKSHIEDSARSIYETGQARFIICIAENRHPIGTIDLFDFDHFHKRVGVGILIAETEYRRKGYARMAIEAIKSYCFDYLKIHQIYCNILSDNVASISLFTDSGFKAIGTKKDWIKTDNGFKDEIIFQLIPDLPGK